MVTSGGVTVWQVFEEFFYIFFAFADVDGVRVEDVVKVVEWYFYFSGKGFDDIFVDVFVIGFKFSAVEEAFDALSLHAIGFEALFFEDGVTY